MRGMVWIIPVAVGIVQDLLVLCAESLFLLRTYLSAHASVNFDVVGQLTGGMLMC